MSNGPAAGEMFSATQRVLFGGGGDFPLRPTGIEYLQEKGSLGLLKREKLMGNARISL